MSEAAISMDVTQFQASAKRAVKRGLQAAGLDLHKIFSGVRLRRSRRQFLKYGYARLPGYDVTHHFGDELLDASFQYAQEGFILARLNEIRQTLDENEIRRATFADIGDSNGVFLKALGKPGVSINTSPRVLENITGLERLQGSLPHIPLPDRSLDYALCFETVEHLQDPISGLRELARLTRKGVFVSIPWVRRTHMLPYWPDRTIPQAETHVFECSDLDFRTLLTYAALRVASLRVYEVFDGPRTIPELVTDLYWARKGTDQLCGVFRKFSIYFLTHDGRASLR